MAGSEPGRRKFPPQSPEGPIHNPNAVPPKNSLQWPRDITDEGEDSKTVRTLPRRSPPEKHANQFPRCGDGVCGWFRKLKMSETT